MANALLTTNYVSGNVVESSQLNSTNTQINALLNNSTSTVTAAGTTTLTNATTFEQIFTGTSAQNVVLPDATTLYVGYTVTIVNQSTGTLTIKNNGGSTLYTILSGITIVIMCGSIDTTNGTWSSVISPMLISNTWTPTDTSGASLTLSIQNATYTQLGNLIFVNAKIIYPSTADTSQVSIGGLPFASNSTQGNQLIGIYTNNSITNYAYTAGSSILWQQSNGVNIKNVNLSGLTIFMSG